MLEDVQVPESSQDIENDEILINYVSIGEKWNQRKIVVENIFAYNVALNIIHEDEDLKLRTIEKC